MLRIVSLLMVYKRVNGLRIDRLSDDYLTVLSPVYLWPELYSYEASAIYKNGNTYFMFASDQSGWGMYSLSSILSRLTPFYLLATQRFLVGGGGK